MDPSGRIIPGDVFIRGCRIAAVGAGGPGDADTVIDATGQAVLPGLVQVHVHLTQTLFRGQADDLELLDWLRQRIWPLEAAHDAESNHAAALLGCAELIRGGTTCILDMGTVHHQDQVFQAMAASGIRGFSGKCMMDWGDGVPPPLREDPERSLQASLDLMERWHGAAGGRIGYCLAPRFALSCSEGLLQEVGRVAAERGLLVHTHASESRAECALVRSQRGCDNVEYMHRLGLTGPRLVLAHCVHVTPGEMACLAATATRVAHCPSSNLKLASGIAPVAEMRRRGISVGLGADGAPCNNNLDGFLELRLAALLQKAVAGPTALPAPAALEMATLGGARVLGLDHEIGSIEVGKRADVITVDLGGLHLVPAPDVVSALVYCARAADVRNTIVDGRVLLRDGRLVSLDEEAVRTAALAQLPRVRHRAGLEP
jgi:cytosine/adenosine deaminase-related metal-dependent hydrolase